MRLAGRSGRVLTAPRPNPTTTPASFAVGKRRPRAVFVTMGLALIALVLSACGEETQPDAAPASVATRVPTARPAPTATPRPPGATVTPSPATDGVSTSEAIDIGSRLQLFVDDYLIEEMSGVELTLHRPTPMETVLELDQPWENDTNGYYTVFKDDDRSRMYYRCSAVVAERTCYAESEDGINWTKPFLRQEKFQGSMENNLFSPDPGVANIDANRAGLRVQTSITPDPILIRLVVAANAAIGTDASRTNRESACQTASNPRFSAYCANSIASGIG